MGEGIGSIRVPIETDLQIQKAPHVVLYDIEGRSEVGGLGTLVKRVIVYKGAKRKPS